MTELYFEDLAVGDRFVTGEHALDAAQIVAFARQFDPQPFHLDDIAAKNSMFGGLAASGWHTAAISMKVLVESGPKIAGGVIGGSGMLTWPRPTRPGDILHVECEVLEVVPSRSRPDRGMIVMRNDTMNQHGEVLQSFTVKMPVPRRPA